MNRYPLGSTGLEVTSICFGTAPLGGMPDTYGYGVDEETARETIRAVFDSPVNFMDTSRNYGLGRSEERIGAVIRERGGLPDGFVLATKLDRDMETGRFDASRARRSLEESLNALGLERIPLLHLHDPEYARDLTEVTRSGGSIEELFRMKEEGLVDAVGLAMGRLDIMLPLVDGFSFDVILSHNRFSLINRSADNLFDRAKARGIAVLNAAPYAGGVLAKGSSRLSRITYQEADENALAPVVAIEQECAKYGVAPGAAALQFSLRDPRITSTVVGVSKPARIFETLEWANVDIPQTLHENLGGCGYSSEDPESARIYSAN